jgi:hypothetical protein
LATLKRDRTLRPCFDPALVLPFRSKTLLCCLAFILFPFFKERPGPDKDAEGDLTCQIYVVLSFISCSSFFSFSLVLVFLRFFLLFLFALLCCCLVFVIILPSCLVHASMFSLSLLTFSFLFFSFPLFFVSFKKFAITSWSKLKVVQAVYVTFFSSVTVVVCVLSILPRSVEFAAVQWLTLTICLTVLLRSRFRVCPPSCLLVFSFFFFLFAFSAAYSICQRALCYVFVDWFVVRRCLLLSGQDLEIRLFVFDSVCFSVSMVKRTRTPCPDHPNCTATRNIDVLSRTCAANPPERPVPAQVPKRPDSPLNRVQLQLFVSQNALRAGQCILSCLLWNVCMSSLLLAHDGGLCAGIVDVRSNTWAWLLSTNSDLSCSFSLYLFFVFSVFHLVFSFCLSLLFLVLFIFAILCLFLFLVLVLFLFLFL